MTDIKCPIPKDQRPLIEYINLKNSFEFNWTTQGTKSFFRTLIIISSVINFILTSILECNNNNTNNRLSEFLLKIDISSTSILIFLMLRVYLAWEYIYSRLNLATINYEESGWYDGQTWIKTPDLLLQDRLVVMYEVLPIIKRLKLILIALLCLFIIKIYTYIQLIK